MSNVQKFDYYLFLKKNRVFILKKFKKMLVHQKQEEGIVILSPFVYLKRRENMVMTHVII